MTSTTWNNFTPEVAPSEEQHELALGDQHLDFIEEAKAEDKAALAVAQISIPAMLCDATLLEEIQNIPNKMAFKIGDVADIIGIKQYVLRYWETEFDILNPKKASNNQRMYTRKDVENALLIRKLLHRDRFSIEGARNAMKELKAQVKKERDIGQVYHKIETYKDRVDDILADIKNLKEIFR